MIVNVETNKYKFYNGLDDDVGSGPGGLVIDGKFHLIGENGSRWHKIWNNKNKIFDKIYEFLAWPTKGIDDFGCAYVKGNDKLKIPKTKTLFGGDIDSNQSMDMYKKVQYMVPFI